MQHKNKDQLTALISGASSGIGLASAARFLKEGLSVVALYRSDKSQLEELQKKYPKLHIKKVHLEQKDQLQKLIEDILETFGVIDCLVNCAGSYYKANSFEEIDLNSWDEVFSVNLKAPLHLAKELIPAMKSQKWGRIINISSCSVKHGGNPKSSAYTASKAALEALSISIAKEGAPHNILSNAVRVGVTDTKFHAANPAKNMQKRINQIGLKRMAEPEEIASFIWFLCSEDASFITGSVHDVDGGDF